MGKMLHAFIYGLLFVLAACATVPMSSPEQDAAGKSFSPPPSGQAALYIYREGAFGGASSLAVAIGPRNLGALASDTWFRLELDPGTYDVRCNAENTASVVVPLAAGETRYVEAEIRMGVMAPRCAVIEVWPQTARPAILAGKRAAEIR